MTIDISSVTVRGRPEFKLRIDEVLHGIFKSEEEAREYAQLPEVADIVADIAKKDESWK
jgi:hypothetical protein